jgi:coenzyme F420 hydrogenase subunit beta
MSAADSRFRRIIEEGMCIACGLCAGMYPDKLAMAVDAGSGYLRPAASASLTDGEVDAIYAVCPGLPADKVPTDANADAMWGPWLRIDKAHASDPEIRHKAATGGVLTALADYLIASGTTASILHVRAGGLHPTFGTPHVSHDRAAILAGAGSRYGPADPLSGLIEMLNKGEPFAVVAKPCDISAIRLLGCSDARVDGLITHMLTMVCGGFMLPFGMRGHFERIGIAEDDVAAVSYRGNGCPGPARVTAKDGAFVDRGYLEFWGEDAALWHLPWRCKICPDGIGEGADIAAADCWPGGAPTLEMIETDPGSNAVITRTKAGRDLFEAAVAAGYLTVETEATLADLANWQPRQVNKKTAWSARNQGQQAAGHQGLRTEDMTLETLAATLDPKTRQTQSQGTANRIAIGKHQDNFGGP